MIIQHPPEWGFWLIQTANPDPFIWLYEMRAPDGGPLVDEFGNSVIVRLTANGAPVVWGADGDGTPLTWSPYPITHGEISRDDTGAMAAFNLTVSNAAAFVMATAEANDYFDEHRLIMRLVHSTALDDPALADPKIEATVTNWSADWNAFTLVLSAFDLADFSSPKALIDADSCRWQYRGPGCFFTGDPGNATLGPCAKTKAACTERGDWDVAAGKARMHPRQFGGFPGSLRGVRATG